MRRFLTLLIIPLLLSSCSVAREDTRFASIIDGKTFVDFIIPHNLAASDTSSRILRIIDDEATKTVVGSISSSGNSEIGKMQLAYREFTGKIYPVHLLTPAPVVNFDGLSEAEAKKAYVEAMISHQGDSIDAAKQAKKTGTGATLVALADMVIANHTLAIEKLETLLSSQ